MIFYLKMAFESILVNKKKFWYNVVGIMIGVVLLVLVSSLSNSFKDELYAQMKISDDRVITIAIGDKNNTLTYTYLPVFDTQSLDVIKQENNISKYAGLKYASVTSIYYTNNSGEDKRVISSYIYSSDMEFLNLYGAIIKDGSFCEKEDELIIGNSIANTYNINIGDYLTIDYLNEKYQFKVTGILDYMNTQGYSSTPTMINNIVFLSEESAIFKDSNYVSIVAEVSDVNLIDSESSKLTGLLNKDENMSQELKDVDMDAIVVNNLAILDMIDGYFMYVNIFIKILYFIISLIVIINFSNLMTITIYGRKREIGIMKIVGGSNFQVSQFYIFECLFTGFVGSVIGIILGIGLVIIIVNTLNWNFYFSIIANLTILGLGILSPTIAGMLTQNKIKKQTLSDIFSE